VLSSGQPGDWSSASNWSNGVPTSNSIAYIANAGTATVSLSGEVCFNLCLGDTTNPGTVQMTGGGLSTYYAEYVGYSGTGTFVQSGGTNSNNVLGMYLGYNSGSRGDYELSGTGVLSVASEGVGNSGVGNFNQTGGKNTTSDLSVKSGSSYSLSSGSLSVGTEYQDGTFAQSGGTHTVGDFEASGACTLSGTGSLSANDELINGGVFTQSGGTNSITSTPAGGLIPCAV
jgi:hypothetical protein